VGCGATFNIYLPISDKKAVLDEREEEKIHKGSETILLVDDEQLVIDVGKALLEKMGYHVMVAQNGEEAVRKVRKIRACDRLNYIRHDYARHGWQQNI
jgi:two-component system cell cycle sensor histidine kinase/response regulator CckA